MFEIVEAIHKAIRTESTMAFVLLISLCFACGGGVLAWIVDKGYKNSAEYLEAHSTEPLVEANVSFDKVLEISNGSGNPLRELKVTFGEYKLDKSAVLQHRVVIATSSIQGGALLSQSQVDEHSVAKFDLMKQNVAFVGFDQFGSIPADDLLIRYYAMRITFRYNAKKFCLYRVTGAVYHAPSFFENPERNAVSGPPMPWLYSIPSIVLADMRMRYLGDRCQEISRIF